MKRLLPWLNIAAAAIAIFVNVLANALPLNGKNTGVISDQFKVFFVPAGYVFAIWGVIYIGWIAFAVYQALPSQRENPRLQRIGWWFALASLVNAGWLFAWHYEQFALSAGLMIALLLMLITIYVRLDIGRTMVSRLEQWTVDIPFSVYLGWISVATIANIADLLYLWKWDGWGVAPEIWTMIMLGVAVVLGLAMAITRADAAYLAVFVWSFVGIAAKQAPTPLVANAAWAAAAAALALIPIGMLYRRRETRRVLRPEIG